jgi:hypothetical protein
MDKARVVEDGEDRTNRAEYAEAKNVPREQERRDPRRCNSLQPQCPG